MPTARNVSLVQKLKWHVSGNISPTAFAIGDVDGRGDNAFVIGNLVGELFIFKGNHPEGLPWMTCKGLGTITAVAIGDIRNWGKNSIVVMSAEGLCHIFDVTGLEDESGYIFPSGTTMPSVPTTPGVRPGQAHSIYSSTPLQSSYQAPGSSHHGHNTNPTHPNLPATPNLRPVPDIHHSQHGHHATSHPHHGTPPLPPPAQNTPHGSASSSVSGFHHQTNTPNNTPTHSHPGSIHGGTNGARRGSEAFMGPGSVARTTAVLANLIGTPPVTNTLHGSGAASTHRARSTGVNSAANSPTGTPLLRPQHVSSTSGAPGPSARDHALKKNHAGSTRHGASGKPRVRDINGRRVLDRPNLTLPVPVNINRAYIADIDGDGLNEIVLARTDRILHSYSLQANEATSPTTASHPSNQPLNLVKLLSRTDSVSTLDSSGLLSPLDDRKENVIHCPSLASMGRQYHVGSTGAMTGAGAAQGNSDAQDNGGVSLLLVEKKRWALDGQIHCLAVTKDIHTGMPILLVAQPGLKFIMVDHTGNMSEPVTQVQRNPKAAVNVAGPDTPTRSVGTGDVATDIICGTHYVNGEKKDIIGLMSMDGAFALRDLENNTVKVHDLDSTHKIFGFSKLNFGNNYMEQQTQDSRRAESVYGRSSNRRADENNTCDDDDVDDIDSNAGDTFAETLTLGHGDCSDGEEDSRYSRPNGRRSARELASSMLVSEPYGSRFQKDDMFVGCSWSGITFFIDQDFNTAKYDFDARVCAFGAGQFAITPGRNEPCLFYVDFEDNIYVYYNLYIQTEPSVQFQDVVKADAALVRASQKICLENAADKDHERPEDSPGFAEAAQPNRENASSTNVPDYRLPTSEWLERDMKNFIHDSLYNVDRYEDEFQQLKRLADIERAKRAAFLEAEANKERAQQGAELKDVAESAVALAGTAAVTAKESLAYMDPRLRRPPHVLTVDIAAGLDLDSGPKMTRSHSRGKAAQRGQFRGHGITTSQYALARQGMANQGGDDDNDDQLSSLSPVSPILLPSPKPRKASRETRRSSLLIKDVLSHYEGKTTPPLKSPTSPSASSSLMSKDLKSGSSQTATGPSTALKRFSIMEVSNGGRISRSSSTSSGSSGSNSSSSQSTITQGHPLTKGKGLETRIGKALRANRPAGVSRNRPLGVMGRKSGARSRLSLQQHRDDTEDGDDEALSEDGTGETDGDNLAEFDRPSRKSAGEYDFQQNQDFEAELAAEDFYNGARGNAGNEGEEGAHGVYTPSTISPIPSPGRFYGSQQGSTAEPSASLDGTAYMFSRGLLSPTTRSAPSGATAATSTAGAIGKTSRQSDQDYYGPSSLSSFRGHARQRSGHGLLDTGLGHLQTREIAVSSGIGSGPNSAGHSSVQDGRRSRAESVLSTGSDIGGMVVPDITLLASSFPNQPSVPFSMSDPLLEEETSIKEYDESDDDVANAARDDHGNPDNAGLAESKERSDVLRSGVRRPPQRSATLGSQDGASHGTGSGSDTATGKSIGQRSGQSGGEERAAAVKSGDVKLLPAPLPRSNQHHQRHQLEQQGSSGSVTGSNGSKDPGHSTSTQVSFSSSACPNSAIGGGVETRDGMHEGGEGFGRGRSGKASSTTSSTAVSDFGSGPSSPLTSNVTVTNAILSNPSTNSYKGFSVLSFPLASPSASTASAQQHQYFAPSHYHQYALPPHPHSGASAHSSSRGIDRVSAHDDDKMSIRSRASTYRSIEDNNDISSVLAAATSSLMGSGSGGSGSEHGLYRISPASTSSSHLVSDSLVRRLEELQQQDRDLERQRQKEREKDKDRDREKEKEKDRSRSGQSSRPPALSRANSGASIRSSVSHHRTPIPHPPTSHVSATGSNYGSGLASGPVSGSGSVSGSAFGSTPGSGPASGPGRHTAGIVRINTILGNERRSDQA